MEELNWVAKRAECSLSLVFAALEMSLHGDVKARNAAQPPRKFEVLAVDGRIRVLDVSHGSNGPYVEFRQTENAIVAENNRQWPTIAGHLAIDDEGECRIGVHGHLLKLWQFRKAALEALFFGEA